MSDLLDGSTVPWHIVSGQHEPAVQPDPLVLERVRARRAAAAAATTRMQPVVLEQTRLLARAGLAARDLSHALANNLRQLRHQEESRP